MSTRAKTLRAPEISLHFDFPCIECSSNVPHSQRKHGLVSRIDTFTCSLALNRMFSCPLDCLSLLSLLHSSVIQPHLVLIQPKSDQIEQILPHQEYISIFFWDLPALRSSLTYGHAPVCFRRGSVSAVNAHLLRVS